MKSKNLSLLFAGVLSLVLFASFISAITLSLPTSTTDRALFQNQIHSITFNITSNVSSNFTITDETATIEDVDSNDVDLTITSITSLNNVTSATFNVSTSGNADFNFGKKYYTDITISAVNAINASDTSTIEARVSFENNYVCSVSDNGNLDISIEDITVKKGFGDDEEWFPFDEIEIEIDVENNGNEDIDDIVVEWGLYNVDTGNWVIDDEESDFNLKEDDKETITLSFKLDDLDEFDEGDEYIFYVWATGDDDYTNEDTCVKASDEIEIIIENDFVVLDDIKFPELVSCGSEVQITADVWNIGDDDQDDVYVVIYNEELGINKRVEIGDIDAYDKEKLNAVIKIPENAVEKSYNLLFEVYDDSNDIYENDYDEDESVFELELRVEGSCSSSSTHAVETDALVSANLQSGGKAGGELVVKAVITNLGDNLATYNVNVAEYADWASSPVVEPNIILVAKAGSKEVLITLNVNKDVSGEKTFDIEVMSGNNLIVKQPVSVIIEKSSRSFITGGIISKDNLYLWGIGILNVILVLIIIIVAVKVAKQ